MGHHAMLAEFSSRVIVASDAAGFLRVYVRSGGFDRDRNNSRSSGSNMTNWNNGDFADDFETSL